MTTSKAVTTIAGRANVAKVRRLIRWALIGGLPALLTAMWILSYISGAGAVYDRRGDYSRHVQGRLDSLQVNCGLLIWWHESADAPPPDPNSATSLTTFQAAIDRRPGFEFGAGPAVDHFEERKVSWLGILGFYHYHVHEDNQVLPYGERSTVHAWTCPVAAIALPSWLPLTILIRRMVRKTKFSGVGFDVQLTKSKSSHEITHAKENEMPR